MAIITMQRIIKGLFILIVFLAFAHQAYADMLPIYGPKIFKRTIGTPKEIIDTFQNCEPFAKYKLVVRNGTVEGDNLVTSASIVLNGKEVVGPKDFIKLVKLIEREIAVDKYNEIKIQLAGAPDTQLSIGIECTGNCLDITINSPSNGETVNQSQTLVTGSIQSSAQGPLGVTVNNFPGLVHSSSYGTGNVLLESGVNSITSMVTNRCGNQAQTSIQVNLSDEINENVDFWIFPDRGMSPQEVSFTVQPILGDPIVSIKWDFNGDGTVDLQSGELEQQRTFDSPGLFFPTIEVTTESGKVFKDKEVVLILQPEALVNTLLERWGEFVSALRQEDVEQALSFIATKHRNEERAGLTVMKGHLNELADILDEPIHLKAFRREFVIFTASEPTQIGEFEDLLEVTWVLDRDGVWRIDSY